MKTKQKELLCPLDTLSLVADFHEAFDVAIQDKPYVHDLDLNNLRLKLLSEELDELEKALFFNDKVAAFDALLDLQYVLDGAFLALGFYKFKCAGFFEVHHTNMAKLGADGKPIKRSDGKITKPPGWQGPDLKRILES